MVFFPAVGSGCAGVVTAGWAGAGVGIFARALPASIESWSSLICFAWSAIFADCSVFTVGGFVWASEDPHPDHPENDDINNTRHTMPVVNKNFFM
jgi:hypothetical protein